MRVRVTPASVEVVPGIPVSLQVDVYNTGSIIDGYRVALDGTPGAILEAHPTELSLFPDTEGSVLVSLTLPVSFPAGPATIALRVSSATDPGASQLVSVALVVAEHHDAALRVEPQSVTGGRRARFRVHMANRGNLPVIFHFDGSDAEAALSITFSPRALAVRPGEEAGAEVRVRGRRPLLGAPAARVVTMVATDGEGTSRQAVATFLQKPVVPRGVMTIATIGVAIVLWALLLSRGVDNATERVVPDTDLTLAGAVTSGAQPLGGVDISAAGGKSQATTTSLTDGEVGTFELTGLARDQDYVVTFARDGFLTTTRVVKQEDAAGARHDLGTVVLQSQVGSLAGTVTSTTGQPVPAATVVIARDSRVVQTTFTESSGSVGFFAVSGLAAPGAYRVTVEKAGFVSRSVEVTLAAGAGASDVAVQLAPLQTASIRGLVRENPLRLSPCAPGACALAGVKVTVTDGTAAKSAETASDPAPVAGTYTVAGLVAGDYTVSFAKQGYEPRALQVRVEVGQALTVDAVLAGLPGTVAGTASGCTFVEVRLRDLTRLNPRRSAVPAADGSYGISELRTPGQYRVVFQGPQLRVVDVDLGPGEQRQGVSVSCMAPNGGGNGSGPSPTTTTTTTPGQVGLNALNGR